MVDCVSDAAAQKKQLVEKVQEQGGVFRDIVATWSTFTFKTHTLDTLSPSLRTSGNISIAKVAYTHAH